LLAALADPANGLEISHAGLDSWPGSSHASFCERCSSTGEACSPLEQSNNATSGLLRRLLNRLKLRLWFGQSNHSDGAASACCFASDA